MLIKTKTKVKNILSKTENIRVLNPGSQLISNNESESALKDLFKYFTVSIPEVLIGKADVKAIEKSKKEIENGDFLSLDELVLKIKSN